MPSFNFMSVYLYLSVPLQERGRTFTYDSLRKQVNNPLASCGRNLAVPLQHTKYLCKQKTPGNFFRGNRFFSKTINKINKNILSVLMSKPPPQISFTYCTYSTTLSSSPFCACLWGSIDSCYLHEVFCLTGMHRFDWQQNTDFVQHIGKRRISTED